ncbi:MAG: alpha/beta fold hydrolase [Deltaproteobacteria bacterium]|nr:alpha/beta fold hydrolase [Deltaproteobacteria bacterium]
MLRPGAEQRLSEPAFGRYLDDLARRRGDVPWYARFRTVTIPGGGGQLKLSVIDEHADAPVLIFLPGTNAYALLYGEFLTKMVDRGINVVGVDPRGHGRSEGRRGSYTLDEILHDLRTVVDWTRAHFGGRIWIGGSSQGGIASFYFAAMNSDIDGTICHNIADLDGPLSHQLIRTPKLAKAARPLIRRLARLMPEAPLPMSSYINLAREPVRGMGTALNVLNNDPLTVPFIRLRTLASLTRGPIRSPAHQISCPILVLHGDLDTIFPTSYIEHLFAEIRAEKALLRFPAHHHYMIVDDVDSYIDDVCRFIFKPRTHKS